MSKFEDQPSVSNRGNSISFWLFLLHIYLHLFSIGADIDPAVLVCPEQGVTEKGKDQGQLAGQPAMGGSRSITCGRREALSAEGSLCNAGTIVVQGNER